MPGRLVTRLLLCNHTQPSAISAEHDHLKGSQAYDSLPAVTIVLCRRLSCLVVERHDVRDERERDVADAELSFIVRRVFPRTTFLSSYDIGPVDKVLSTLIVEYD
jgi:hypothetical protein